MRSDIHTYVQTHTHTHTHGYIHIHIEEMHPSGAYLAHVALPTLQWSTGYNCVHIKSTMVARQQPSHMTVYYSLCVFMCVYVYVYFNDQLTNRNIST